MKRNFVVATIINLIILIVATYILLPNYVSSFQQTYAEFGMLGYLIAVIDALSSVATLPPSQEPFTLLLAIWIGTGILTGLIIRKPASSLIGGFLAGVVFGFVLVFAVLFQNNINWSIAIFHDLLAKSQSEVVYFDVYVLATRKFVIAFIGAFLMSIISAILAGVLAKPEKAIREMPSEMYPIEIKCPNCGATYMSHPIYCSACGMKLLDEE